MGKLILVRHGLSEYNKTGLWTGWIDPDLAPEGREQAQTTGEALKDIHFDYAYSNILRRCTQTMAEILKVTEQDLPVTLCWQLLERNYGKYTNKNKWEVKEEVGEEVFQQIRRSWDFPIPNGESLKQVYERAIPYYEEEILPRLKDGKVVLVTSSGNALRALVKYLEGISNEKIGELEFGTGEAYVYDIDRDGKVTNKEVRASNEAKGKV